MAATTRQEDYRLHESSLEENPKGSFSTEHSHTEVDLKTKTEQPEACRLIIYRRKNKVPITTARCKQKVRYSENLQFENTKGKCFKGGTGERKIAESKRDEPNNEWSFFANLEAHVSSIHPIGMPSKLNGGNSSSFCDICQESFLSKIAFYTHNKHLHVAFKQETKDKKYICNLCGNKFISKSALKDHKIRIHSRKHECSICFRTFSRQDKLKRHMSKHSMRKSFTCSFCGKSFKGEAYMHRHETQHTSVRGSWSCEFCDMKFVSSERLNQHVKRAHKIKALKCAFCGFCFKGEYALKIHEATHSKERPFRCDTCNKTYRSIQNVTSHVKHHFYEKPRIYHNRDIHGDCIGSQKLCEICGKNVAANYLYKHINTHTKLYSEQRVECNICHKFFSNAASLNTHKRIHKGDRRFCCDICGKKFVQSYSLTVHMRVHTQVKPFVCETCGMEYTQSYPLTLHKRKHHSVKSKQPTIDQVE